MFPNVYKDEIITQVSIPGCQVENFTRTRTNFHFKYNLYGVAILLIDTRSLNIAWK